MANNIELIPNKAMVQNIVDKIDEIYRQIKKSEVSPNTDYLFSGIRDDKDNFERSMKKMELMNSMSGFMG